MKSTLVLLVVLISASACYSAGVRVTPDQVQGFKNGVTTYGDVVRQLGKPTSTTVASDGTRKISYTFVHAQARAASFIPVVGLFAGGADTEISTVEFSFDQSGKLANYTSSGTEMGASSGVAGARPAASGDQPREARPAKAAAPAPSLPACTSDTDCAIGLTCYEGACRQ